ncbi:MAG: hypothetical protein AB7P03_18340 [Kofleriaceae bacterium]
MQIKGTAVELAGLPATVWIGLPISGRADITGDLFVPTNAGNKDYRGLQGEIVLRCSTGCRLGDDRAALRVGLPARPVNLPFGHLDFRSVVAKVFIADGRALVTQWSTASDDATFELSAELALAPKLEDSKLKGCLRVKPKPALEARDPTLAAVMTTTGAYDDNDHLFHTRLLGTLGKIQTLNESCDIPDEPHTPRPGDPPPPDPNAVATEIARAIEAGITRKAANSYELSSTLIAQIAANPIGFSRGAIITPAMNTGRPAGFKLGAIKRESLFARLGLRDGDTIVAIDEIAMDSMEHALDAYATAIARKPGQSVTIKLERGKTAVLLTCTVR